MKAVLLRIHRLLSSQFGIDPVQFVRAIAELPKYLRDWSDFRRSYSGEMSCLPYFHDRNAEAGIAKSEYFWQDLLVARAIREAAPTKHVDIGSRIDGFVAHVASFREIEVLDVRPLSVQVPGVTFRQADLMDASALPRPPGRAGYCDSVSCLHALEHFGLGRYGERVDPRGYERGFANIASLLEPGGTFYLSVPIGTQRVDFNANWVFDPRMILRLAETAGLTPKKLTVFGSRSGLREVAATSSECARLASESYNLGIFVFVKG